MAYPVIPTDDDKAHFVKVSNYTKVPTEHATGGGWFAKWRKRVTMERMIIRKACRDAIKAGFTVSVDYGEDEEELKQSTDLAKIMDTVCACDEEWLRFYKNGKNFGSIYLVYGNDGWDVLADWHVCLEEAFLKGAIELADKLGDA